MALPADPFLLFSVVNTYLRDKYADLDALCDDLGESRSALEDTLSAAGFTYNREENRFQ